MREIWGDYFDNAAIKPEKDSDVLFVGSQYENWSGSAFALFVKDGKIYECNDVHCSCNGFENYNPEETSKEALLMRKFYGWEYSDARNIAIAIANLDSK
jgi:hypothetical protein